MRQNLKIFLVIISVMVIAVGCTTMSGRTETLQPFVQQSEDTTTTRTVQVSGMGEMQVKPDTAVVTLGVQTQEDTAQAALQTNNAKMQTLVDALKKANVPTENIQTQTIRLSPRYEYDNTSNKRTLIGYTASNIVEVRINDLESVGTLLDQAVKAGANTIENISFDVSDPGSVLDQVRKTAVEDAHHKAEQLASLTGTSLGPIVEIQESSSTPVPVVRQLAAPADAAAVPVSPGSQSVSIQVQVTWELVINGDQ